MSRYTISKLKQMHVFNGYKFLKDKHLIIHWLAVCSAWYEGSHISVCMCLLSCVWLPACTWLHVCSIKHLGQGVSLSGVWEHQDPQKQNQAQENTLGMSRKIIIFLCNILISISLAPTLPIPSISFYTHWSHPFSSIFIKRASFCLSASLPLGWSQNSLT